MKIPITYGRFAPLVLILLALLLALPATAEQEYSDQPGQACLDCHGTPYVLGILKTAHADESDPETPAAKKHCQSCHGPSAKHMMFPMQVENVHFGKQSTTAPAEQNALCLECHHDGDRAQWTASAHGFDNVVCSTCHVLHEPKEVVMSDAAVVEGCMGEGCHVELMGTTTKEDFSHALGKELGDQGELTCKGCHNPHGPLQSDRCVECHAQTPDVLAKESEKAKRFHEVATRRGTECIRCHKGIAHPIPPLALEESIDEMNRMLGTE
jgi:hypothetical protein